MNKGPKSEALRWRWGSRLGASSHVRIWPFVIPQSRWSRLLLIALTFASQASACRFNVRDIAFVELEPGPFRLFVFVNRSTPAAFTNALLQQARVSLRDANVELQLADLDGNATTGARKLAEQNGVAQCPGFVLVAPDQRALALRFDPAGLPPADFARATLEGVVSSPLREAVLKRCLEAYALVVVVEGDDAGANRGARGVADTAVAQIRELMGRLPKPVKSPPEVLVLSRAEAERERIALWSLGVDVVRTNGAATIVLHGRGRRL